MAGGLFGCEGIDEDGKRVLQIKLTACIYPFSSFWHVMYLC